MITRESLLKQREDIVKQRDNALAVYHQAVGAFTLIEHLIGTVSDEISIDDLAKSIGADSVEIEKVL